MIVLTLTRHGQTTENLDGILQGQSPGHLNATGIAQAEALREQLCAEDYNIFLCSDLERTRLSADIINRKLQLPIIFTPLLRERDWGEYTGRFIKDITVHPSQFPPSIENADQLAARTEIFLKYIFNNHNGQRILAMGHGYFNRCVQALIEQRTVHDTPRWGNTELRTFLIDNQVLSHHGPTDYLVSEN
jgi:probable phosphoglycerate mutase